jgi:hypothetical protein
MFGHLNSSELMIVDAMSPRLEGAPSGVCCMHGVMYLEERERKEGRKEERKKSCGGKPTLANP